MRSGLQGFVGEKLAEARLARGITSRKALADMLQRASSTVKRWEEGTSFPEAATLKELSEHLKVPEDFFFTSREQAPATSFFRSLKAALKSERAMQEVRLSWLEDITAVAEYYAYLPTVDVPDLLGNQNFKMLEDTDLEALAERLREHWGIGLRPIPNIVTLLEGKGVIIASEQMETTALDGLSRWGTDGRPYMLLASDKESFARRQFDAAHELAHLVLHRHVTQEELEKNFKLIEDQAHRFASAFLLPASQYSAEIRNPVIWELERLKPRWRVSIKAQIMRLQRLDIIDRSQSSRLFRAYNSRGYHAKGEPFDDVWELQQPATLANVFKALIEAGQIDKGMLRDDMPLLPFDAESLAGLPPGWLVLQEAKVVRLKPRECGDKYEGERAGRVISFQKDIGPQQ